MAKDKNLGSDAPLTAREQRWADLLVAYEKSNPAKYAAKKERGEFDTIPESFV